MDKAQMQEKMIRFAIARAKKAEEIGAKATWSTDNHRDAMAEILAEVVADEVDVAKIRDCLVAIDNISAFQQKIMDMFAPMGHFQREKKGGKTAESYLEKLVREEMAAKKEEAKS